MRRDVDEQICAHIWHMVETCQERLSKDGVHVSYMDTKVWRLDTRQWLSFATGKLQLAIELDNHGEPCTAAHPELHLKLKHEAGSSKWYCSCMFTVWAGKQISTSFSQIWTFVLRRPGSILQTSQSSLLWQFITHWQQYIKLCAEINSQRTESWWSSAWKRKRTDRKASIPDVHDMIGEKLHSNSKYLINKPPHCPCRLAKLLWRHSPPKPRYYLEEHNRW